MGVESRMSSYAAFHQQEMGLKKYFSTLSKSAILSKEEELALAKQVKVGDPLAKNKIIEHHLRLVVKIAFQYRATSTLSILDIIEEGNLGLLHAVEKFEPEKGNRFSTYAVWWIYHYIDRAIMNQGSLVRVPIHVIKGANAYKRLEASLDNMGADRDAELETLAKKMKKHAEARAIGCVSLDDPNCEGVLSHLALHDQHDILEQLESVDLLERVKRALEHLNPLEKVVLVSRFGLSGAEEKTLESLADELSYSREGIRQIQKSALSKLKNHFL